MATRGSDYDSVPPNGIDKSRVLDVKPLRSLVPVFPSNPQSHPFGRAHTFGPPSGVSPFYPFASPQGSQLPPELKQQTHTPTPLRSFPPAQSNGDASHFWESKSQKKARKSRERDVTLSTSESNFDSGISLAQKDDGDRELVESVLIRFDAVRRRISQLEETNKENPSGNARRADLKASNILMSKGVRTNMRKRIGTVPGVEIGDIFFFRMEMCLVGLHSQSMAGIDYIIVRGDTEDETLASSIVSSGGYDDDVGDKDVLIYTGQGGNANKKDNKAAADQKLVRGNLALERSLRRENHVRVIRGTIDILNPTSKIYVYDGLYTIKESWVEKGKSGCSIFKYKFVRMPGQPDAYSVWKSIEKCKEGLSSRGGLILPDLTSGVESIPVSLVNDLDEEKGPAYFTYVSTVKYPKSFKLTQPSYECSCRNACSSGDPNCSCLKRNGGYLPYSAHGVLVSRKQMVYECGPSCPCFANCKNRVSQTGIKVRLEVFKTKNKGWGLRSWDPIRAGTFICEYAGEVVENARQNGKEGENDDYIFDTSRAFHPFRWNTEPGLIEEDASTDNSEEYSIPTPLIISAKNVGNVARFMNHSCNPNIFWQPITVEQNSESLLHIGLFAVKHIPPMTELTYDYGSSLPNKTEGTSASDERKKCLCGSLKCRGYFG